MWGAREPPEDKVVAGVWGGNRTSCSEAANLQYSCNKYRYIFKQVNRSLEQWEKEFIPVSLGPFDTGCSRGDGGRQRASCSNRKRGEVVEYARYIRRPSFVPPFAMADAETQGKLQRACVFTTHRKKG